MRSSVMRSQVVDRGYPVAGVSERLGISTKSLYTWRAQFSQPRKQINETTEQAAELRRLKRELARVSEERDILKNGHRVLRQGCKVRSAFMAEHRPVFSIRAMCRCLRLHPSGFYAWIKKPVKPSTQEDVCQTKLLKEAWEESGNIYGYRKPHDDLCDLGETCCPNHVARLARLAGIYAQIGFKRRPASMVASHRSSLTIRWTVNSMSRPPTPSE